ncbi:hypothetical protein R3P38DRAFT_2951179 [Favolaschia claudopus]|uniref:Secreted protein n=1 Tax=Favolaschia claudopus TaxID=2862362 RepID=A0AAW0BF79_9AGAR
MMLCLCGASLIFLSSPLRMEGSVPVFSEDLTQHAMIALYSPRHVPTPNKARRKQEDERARRAGDVRPRHAHGGFASWSPTRHAAVL